MFRSLSEHFVDIFAGSTYSNCESNTQTSYAFGQNKNVTKTVQAYSDSNCITATGQPTEVEYTYALGAEITANDALKAQEFDLTEAGSGTTYTLVRLSGGLLGTDNLNFGATLPSSPGFDGSTSALRHDGVDLMTTYELQTTP